MGKQESNQMNFYDFTLTCFVCFDLGFCVCFSCFRWLLPLLLLLVGCGRRRGGSCSWTAALVAAVAVVVVAFLIWGTYSYSSQQHQNLLKVVARSGLYLVAARISQTSKTCFPIGHLDPNQQSHAETLIKRRISGRQLMRESTGNPGVFTVMLKALSSPTMSGKNSLNCI